MGQVIYDPSLVEKKTTFIDIDGNEYDQPTSGFNPTIEPINKETPPAIDNNTGVDRPVDKTQDREEGAVEDVKK